MFLHVILAIGLINLIIAGILALVTFGVFNYVFVDPIESFKRSLKNKVMGIIDSNIVLKKTYSIFYEKS